MRWLGVLFGVMAGALGVSATAGEVQRSQPVVFVDNAADSDLDVLVVQPPGQGPERRVEMPGDWPAVLDHPAWSPTGEALVVTGWSGSGARLFEVDLTVRDPEPVELVAGRGPSWAPDGHQLAYEDDAGSLAVYDARDGSVTRLVSAERHESYECPTWSPDGSQLATRLRSYDGSVEWHTEVILVDPDRPTQARSLHSEEGGVSCPTWAPDGGRVAFSDPRSRIHILDLEGRVVGGVDGPDCAIDQSPDWGPSGILFSRSFVQPPPVTLYDGDCPDDGVTGIWLADPTGAVPDSLVVRTVDVSSGPIWGYGTDQFTFDQLDQEQGRQRSWIADLDGNAAPLTGHGDLSDRAVIGPAATTRTGDGSDEQPAESGVGGQPAPASSESTDSTAPADRPAEGSEPDGEASGEAAAPVDDAAEEPTQPTAIRPNTARDDRTLPIALAASAILATAGAVLWRFKLRS